MDGSVMTCSCWHDGLSSARAEAGDQSILSLKQEHQCAGSFWKVVFSKVRPAHPHGPVSPGLLPSPVPSRVCQGNVLGQSLLGSVWEEIKAAAGLGAQQEAKNI